VQLDEANMQNSSAKTLLAVLAFTLLNLESSAERLGTDGSVGQELHVGRDGVALPVTLERLQELSPLPRPSLGYLLPPGAVRLPFVSPFPALAQDQTSNLRKDTLNGTVIGFGLGSIMSSGSAQEAVNQEGRREESVKQEKARKKATTKESLGQESASKQSSAETSGESGKGVTASGAGAYPTPSRPASDNW
jgi:hypothetical protein